MTVSEVSGSTRIREVIIRGIERDDFSACGGDFYARGHIRAIAAAVGTDPRPLIEEYDSTRRVQEIAAASVLAALGFAGYLFLTGSRHPARAGVHHPPSHSGQKAPGAAGGSHHGSDSA